MLGKSQPISKSILYIRATVEEILKKKAEKAGGNKKKGNKLSGVEAAKKAVGERSKAQGKKQFLDL